MKFSVLALIGGSLATKQCERDVEVMILQDASSSFYLLGENMAERMTPLLEAMDTKLGTARAAVSLFCDKPLPYRGVGKGRGHPAPLDFCYDNKDTYEFSTDPEILKKGFEAIGNRRTEGGDYPENPYEGMIYAALDPKVKWSAPDAVYDSEGKRIVKVLVTVTDDVPHMHGDAKQGIVAWNPQPAGVDDGELHFYDEGFEENNAFYRGANDYPKLYKLYIKEQKTPEEVTEFQRLLSIYGPDTYDDPITHPGTFEVRDDCDKYEYPTLETVGGVLNNENVLPVILVAAPTMVSSTSKRICAARGFTDTSTPEKFVECLLGVYNKDMEDAGVKHYMVGKFNKSKDTVDSQSFIDEMVNMIDKLSRDVTCPDDPTPGPNPTPVTTANPTPVTTPNPTPKPDPVTTPEPAPVTTVTTPEPKPEPTTTTEPKHKTSTEETTGSYPFVVPPPPDNKKTVVACATGGSLAGLAAVGGVLYKKFGASLLGHSSTPDMSAVEQVEVPDSPLEREAYEEVTMDMFQ